MPAWFSPNIGGSYDPAGAAAAAQAAAIAASQGAWNVVTKTTAYTAVAWDYILADTTGGTFAITVPAQSVGKQWGVKWIAGAVAPTFVGFTSPPTLSILNQGMEFVSDGTVWRQINRPALAQLPDYPTVTDARYALLMSYASKSASYTLTNADDVVEFTVASSVATLHDATTATKKRYTIKNTSNGNITFATTSSQTVDGSTTGTIVQYQSLEVVPTGANWIVT